MILALEMEAKADIHLLYMLTQLHVHCCQYSLFSIASSWRACSGPKKDSKIHHVQDTLNSSPASVQCLI